jgi:quercetin dioxygenase-like cupin family protein
MSSDLEFVNQASARESRPEPGIVRRVGAYNEKLLLAEHRMDKGFVGSAHSHPHDQAVYVVSGLVLVSAGGRTFEAGAGESFIVRGGVTHQVTAIEPSIALDVFTPCREDFL